MTSKEVSNNNNDMLPSLVLDVIFPHVVCLMFAFRKQKFVVSCILKNVPCPPPTHHMPLPLPQCPQNKTWTWTRSPIVMWPVVGITSGYHLPFPTPDFLWCQVPFTRQRWGKNFPKEVFYDPLPNKYPHILLVDPPLDSLGIFLTSQSPL